MLIVNNTQPPQGRKTRARKHDVALGRLSLDQHPILEGPNDSLDADPREQGDFGICKSGAM